MKIKSILLLAVCICLPSLSAFSGNTDLGKKSKSAVAQTYRNGELGSGQVNIMDRNGELGSGQVNIMDRNGELGSGQVNIMDRNGELGSGQVNIMQRLFQFLNPKSN